MVAARQPLIALVLAIASASSVAASGDPLIDAARNGNGAVVRTLLSRGAKADAADADGTTALHWAAQWNDITTADSLLRARASANAATDYGVTPLFLACLNASAPMATRLLQAGANPNVRLANGETPLMVAARTGNAQVVSALIAHGAQVNARETIRGQTAIMWAASENHPDVIRELVSRGADVDARSNRGFTALLFAARDGSLEAAQALSAAGASTSATLPDRTSSLLLAATNGRGNVVRWLLDSGADANAANDIGMTPLHAALFRQKPDPATVDALLSHGANPNARLLAGPASLPHEIGLTRYAFLAGATPFIMAALAGEAAAMRAIAAKGGDPALRTNNGTTALVAAIALAGSDDGISQPDAPDLVEAVRVALQLGVDINAATSTGQTALHAAAGIGADAVIEFLASHGAMIQARDKGGRTPRVVAENALRNGGSQTTVDLLRKLGG